MYIVFPGAVWVSPFGSFTQKIACDDDGVHAVSGQPSSHESSGPDGTLPDIDE